MQKLSLLSPVLGIQKRLKAVEADTPFGSLFKILLPGPLASILVSSCQAWGCTVSNAHCKPAQPRMMLLAYQLTTLRDDPCAGVHPSAAHAS